MRTILKGTLLVVFTVILFTSCNSNSSNKDKTVNELITHFRDNGYNGEESEKAFAMIGAVDGKGYYGEDFNIEIYKFKDTEDIPQSMIYTNGNFGMMVHEPSESQRTELVDTFNGF